MDVSEIFDELVAHGFEDTEDAVKLTKLNAAYRRICSLRPWNFLEATTTLTFNGSSPVPTNLPTNFRAALSIINPSTGVKVRPERIDVVKELYGSNLTTVGDPHTYYFRNRQLLFYPIPSASTTLSMEYVRKPTALTDSSVSADILIPEDFHDVLVLGTLYRLYMMDDDPTLAAGFRDEYREALQEMAEGVGVLQYDEPERVYVLEDDYYDDIYYW